jgi:high-affinity nickel-transport protein
LTDATTSLAVLCGLTFLLGLRHGFDADHLAVIDAVSRLNAADHPGLARYCGALFSLGHGTVVVFAAYAASQLAKRWAVPTWLESTGVAISVVFLIALGIANLSAAWRATPSQVVRPVGFRSRLVPQVRHPIGILGVGMLFAFSFDTISQATFIAVAGSQLGGAGPTVIASLCFVAGMLVTDGLNGLWIARLLRGADRRAAAASRAMAFVIGLCSLGVGLLAISALALPQVGAWTETYGIWLGLSVALTATVTFVLAVRLTPPGDERPA